MINRDYSILWGAQFITQMGSRLYMMALSWHFVSTLGDNAGLAIMFAIASIPSLLFGVFIGPLIERWNKKHLIVACNIICSMLVGALALLVQQDMASATVIYIICFLMNALVIFVSPSVNSMIPAIIPSESLQQGMSYMRMINYLGQILGAAVGGMLVGVIGVVPTIAINAFALLFAAMANGCISYQEQIKATTTKYLTMMKEGWLYFIANKLIFRSTILSVACNLFIPIVFVFIPIIIKSQLGLDALHFGFADAMIPVGAVIVSLVLARVRIDANPLMVLAMGIAGTALSYGILAFTSNYYVILATLLCFGFSVNFINVTIITYLVRIVAADHRGRFFSILESFSYASISIAYVLSSIMVEYLSVSMSMKICSGALFALVLLTMLASHQEKKINRNV